MEKEAYSGLQDKLDQTQEALASLRIVEKIYKTNYSEVHAKTCKVKRNISLLCLKSDQNFAALEELRQVEDLERTECGRLRTREALPRPSLIPPPHPPSSWIFRTS